LVLWKDVFVKIDIQLRKSCTKHRVVAWQLSMFYGQRLDIQ